MVISFLLRRSLVELRSYGFGSSIRKIGIHFEVSGSLWQFEERDGFTCRLYAEGRLTSTARCYPVDQDLADAAHALSTVKKLTVDACEAMVRHAAKRKVDFDGAAFMAAVQLRLAAVGPNEMVAREDCPVRRGIEAIERQRALEALGAEDQ